MASTTLPSIAPSQLCSRRSGVLCPSSSCSRKEVKIGKGKGMRVVCMATSIPADRVPDMGKRQLMNLLLLGAVALPSTGMLIPYTYFFVPPGSGSATGGTVAKDALGNDVLAEQWLKAHGPGDRTLTQGLKCSEESDRKHKQRMTKFQSFVFVVVSALVLIFQSCPFADALYGPSSPVVQLNPSNFKSKVLNSNGVVLVEFFAPWCGHCQALTPTWEKAANVLKGVATVAALDANAHQSLAQEYGIKGFPTIKVFAPGKPPVDYQGARDVKPIAEFALKQVKQLLKDRLDGKSTGGSSEKKEETNASVELNSRNFDELVIKSKELWIVEFFAPWCGHCKRLAPEWKKAANNLKGKVNLGHVDCDAEKSLMSRFKVQGFPTILVFGADKDSPAPYEGARTAAAIESFALEQLETNVAPPEVTELHGPDVMEEKCGSAAICFVAFLPDILDSKAEGRNRYIQQLLSVAEKFKRSPYSYVWAAAGKQPDLEKHVGVGGYGYPALVALNLKKAVYAPLKSAYEHDHIVEFVKEAGQGGKGNLPLGGTPTIVKTEPWDGKDGEIMEEDEFSLEELMGEDSSNKDEL